MTLPPHDWHAPIVAGIVAAYARSRAVHYVEIGVDRGDTLAVVAKHAAIAHGVDLSLDRLTPGYGLRERRNVRLHRMSSDEFFEGYGGGLEWPLRMPPDVVFVDGDHTADQVAADVNGALRILAADGTVIVHDTLPQRQEWADSNCGDGWRIVTELHGDARLQVFTVPLFPGLTLVSPRPAPIAL